MMTGMKGAIVILAAAVLGACSADHNLGGEPTGGAGTGDMPWRPLPDAGADAGPEVGLLGTTQSWLGYIEHQMFPSGSDDIKLTFATDSAGNVVGTMTFGQGTPPPRATDPDVGYPTSLDANKIGNYSWWFLAEGYPYAFSGTLEGSQLHVKASFAQLWRDWCPLQTPYPPGSCLPYATGTQVDPMNNKCQYMEAKGPWTPIDCGKFLLCGRGTGGSAVCECGETGCRAPSEGIGTAIFDMQLSDDVATGTASGTFSGNAHFTKDR